MTTPDHAPLLQIKEGTFMEVRAYTIAAAQPNIYSYLSGATAPDALGIC